MQKLKKTLHHYVNKQWWTVCWETVAVFQINTSHQFPDCVMTSPVTKHMTFQSELRLLLSTTCWPDSHSAAATEKCLTSDPAADLWRWAWWWVTWWRRGWWRWECGTLRTHANNNNNRVCWQWNTVLFFLNAASPESHCKPTSLAYLSFGSAEVWLVRLERIEGRE